MTLKIEVGKEYVTRSGAVVRCESIDSGESTYPAHMVAKSGARFELTMDGRFFSKQGWGDHELDIVSEYRAAEPAPTLQAAGEYKRPADFDGPDCVVATVGDGGPAEPEPAITDEAQIKHMVERFLNWKLPENFNPDGGISFEPVGNKGTPHEYRREPVGTNLFDAIQAAAMVRYMLEGCGSAPADDYSDEVSDVAMKKMATLSSGLEFETADEPESLRDKFAMAALTGLLSDSGTNATPWSSIAADAYRYADAMMEARKKP